jgi:pyridoxamine 5'-phosphate oxidase
VPDRTLLEEEVAATPLAQFHRWLAEAREAGQHTPEAVALATATPDGAPSVRMVLLKEADERGLVFYTDLGSRKASELDATACAALLFHWPLLGRQVRVEGAAGRVADAEADAYWGTRPLASRLSAFVSRQSSAVPARSELETAVAEAARTPSVADARPPHWGGFRVAPERWEFWQHREHRLHDRVRYTRAAEGWRRERLAP